MFAHTLVVRHRVLLKSYFFRPMTCVTITKHAFGIESRALFPDGLLADLRMSKHAEVLNGRVETEGNIGAAGRAASG